MEMDSSKLDPPFARKTIDSSDGFQIIMVEKILFLTMRMTSQPSSSRSVTLRGVSGSVWGVLADFGEEVSVVVTMEAGIGAIESDSIGVGVVGGCRGAL